MYKNTCKFCKKEITVEKQQLFASHVSSCNPNKEERFRKLKETLEKQNPINKYTLKCKCGKDFDLEIKKSYYERGEYRKTCSKSCASSNIKSEESKKKTSNSIKNSIKSKEAIEKRKGIRNNLSENRKELLLTNSRIRIINDYIFYVDTCQYCNQELIHKNPGIRKYHSDCWKKCSGGYKEGSVKNFKSGTYKGFYCDSSWELAYVIYNLDHNIKFERNSKGFEYTYEGKKHNYYPDFILEDGTYIEIKNYKSKLTESKINNFPSKIQVLYKEDLSYVFDYVINKYGKDYIQKYE